MVESAKSEEIEAGPRVDTPAKLPGDEITDCQSFFRGHARASRLRPFTNLLDRAIADRAFLAGSI